MNGLSNLGVNEHTLNLQPKYFDLISSGEKTLEGRLNDEKRKTINVGDIITFYKEPERVESMQVVVLDKFLFKSFDEMAENLDKKQLGFASFTKQQMIDVYRTFYSQENEKKYGVVVFKVKRIKQN